MTFRTLTPPGVGAIAVVETVDAWPVLRSLVRIGRSRQLPESPILDKSWFGVLADGDEVMIVVTRLSPCTVEIHSHGGVRIGEWIRRTLQAHGLKELHQPPDLIAHASTLRTAGIILDQMHGAFERSRADQFANVGRHVIEPFQVVIAGPPNAGKSSLVNAIVGHDRSIVSPVPGTTRDLLRTRIALDGWPVELIDSAGIRETDDEIEAQGVAHAKAMTTDSDLTVWIMDATQIHESLPPVNVDLLVANKIDLLAELPDAKFIPVSAVTGQGIDELLKKIIRRLVPVEPKPGDSVPVFPEHFSRLDS